MKNVFYIVVGVILGFFGSAMLSECSNVENLAHVPQIAGQDVPQENFMIDFTKRYDVICSDHNKEKMIYSNVKILGYAGEHVKESGGFISKGYNRFNRWLVLETADNRRVYLSENKIEYLEEATVNYEP